MLKNHWKGFAGRLLGIGLSFALAFSMLPVMDVSADPESPEDVYYGDLNCDGLVNTKDITLLRRHLAGGWGAEIVEERADINSDGVVNAKDVTLLRRYLAGGWGISLPEKTYDIVSYPVPIDEDHFPDELFRNYILSDFDENEDGMLSKEEAEEYSEICLGSDFKVKDLTGLQYFPKITRLECSSNLLTSIDVSKNTALERLVLNGNQLTELDISANKALTYLLCVNNKLTTLNLNNNSELVECWLFSNNLTSLNVSNNTKLKVLDCEGNHISQLTLANNNDLMALNILDNDIESIDLSGCPKLKEVVCDEETVLLRKVELSQDTVEDDLFREYLCRFDLDSDGYLSEEEISAVKDIDISGKNIKSIRGIEMFRHLDSFNCSNTMLTSLRFYDKFSENTVVRVDRIDACNNPQLEYIECWDMGVSEINVNLDTGLQTLYVSYNNLSELDLSTNIALTRLSCSGNNIETLDLRGNAKLKKENVTSNPDTTLLMAQEGEVIPFVEINNTNFPDDIFRQFVENYYDEDEDGMLCAEEVLAVTYLGCGPSTYAYDQLGINREDYGEDEDRYVYDLDRAEYNYYLAGNGIKSLKGIEYFPMLEEVICWYNQIEELDLTNNPNIVSLICSCNALNKLDLSKNSKLKHLNCENNNLTALDISCCEVLESLFCNNNNIEDLDLGNNARLNCLEADNNRITNIDISGTQVINGIIRLPEGAVAKYVNIEITFGAMGKVVYIVEKDEEGNVLRELVDIIYEDGLKVSLSERYPDGTTNLYSYTYYTNRQCKKESVIYSDGSSEEKNYREDGSLLSTKEVNENGFYQESTYDCNGNQQTYVYKTADGKILDARLWEYIEDDEGDITTYIVSDYDENGLKIREQGWSYELDRLLWTKTERLSSYAGMYYSEEGTEVFVPWQKLVDDGIIEVQYGAITKIDAAKIKGRLEIQNGVTHLEAGFWGSEMESVYIPRSLTSITINGGDASSFRYCYNLVSIEVDPGNPVFDSRNNCNAIIDTVSNTLILGCKTTIIPSDVVAIGNGAFMSSGIESIDIPCTIKKIGDHAFWDNRKLKTVTLNEGLEYIGSGAFEDVELLETITIPSTVTYIGDMALAYNDSVTSINVDPNNSKYDSRNNCNAIIESSTGRMIVGCINTVIPEGVKVIGPYALMSGHIGATIFDTESIILPSTLEKLENEAIHGINYKHITFLGAPPMIEENNFVLWDYQEYGFKNLAELEDIIVPAEYLGAYKELLPQYADKIFAAE